MADFHEFYPLRQHNTLGFDVRARYAVAVRSESDLVQALADPRTTQRPAIVLGGGSNVVLTGDLDAVVLLMQIPGYTVAGDDDAWLVTVGAGENWHATVNRTIADGMAGLENLALIPGSVGAAPIQNIGAYGVELRERFHSLRAWDRQTRRFVTLSLADCAFGYRDSLFKRAGRDRYVITAVTLRLPRRWQPALGYAELAREVHDRPAPDAAAIRDAVIAIRQRKLPDPAVLGNAGSFFKNPMLPREQAELLSRQHPALPVFPGDDDGNRKLSAAWMIQACGWKGRREGDAGVSPDHALVLVNHGNASGAELLALARRISASVLETFGVPIEPEPRLVGARW